MRTKVTQTSTEMAEVTLLNQIGEPQARVEISIDSLPGLHTLLHHAAELGRIDYTPGELESSALPANPFKVHQTSLLPQGEVVQTGPSAPDRFRESADFDHD